VLAKLHAGPGLSPRIDAAVQIDLEFPVVSLFCSSLLDGKDVLPAQQDSKLDVFCSQTRTIQHFKFDIGLLLASAPHEQVENGEDSSEDGDDVRNGVARPGMTPSSGSTNQLLSPMELLGVSAPAAATAATPPAPAAVPVAPTPVPTVPVPKSIKAHAATSAGSVASSTTTTDSQALVKEAMESQMADLRAFLKQESLARSQEERERQKLLLQALAKTVQTIPQTVQVLLQEELNSPAFIDRIANAVVAKTSANGGGTVNSKSIQVSVQKAISSTMGDQHSGLIKSLGDTTQREISAAFRSTFAESLVPAFQAGCQEMVQQWRGAAASVQFVAPQNNSVGSVAPRTSAPSAPPGRPSQDGFGDASWARAGGADNHKDNVAIVKAKLAEVDAYLASGNFESAFYVALCSSNLQVLVATCQRVDRDQLLAANSTVSISQGILLTMLQQLSVDLATDTELKVLWLTSVFFKLDTTDPAISEHATRYLDMLRTNLDGIAPQYDIPGRFPSSTVAFNELSKALKSAPK
jgi:hypothetical protein